MAEHMQQLTEKTVDKLRIKSKGNVKTESVVNADM